jgi:pimeloyl-ACP methyl ester carboxylesterase
MRSGGAMVLVALSIMPLASYASPDFDALELCELSTAGGQLTVEARCGTLTVTEDPNANEADAPVVDLAYAILPARSGKSLPDPIFFLAGGPGQSARETAPMMQAALRDLHANRDLVFLDQRGTGGSNKLDCEVEASQENWINPDPSQALDILTECAKNWNADLRFYTTTVAAHDLDKLRAHLGYETVNLIGGSYGTRLGQVYLKHFSERVRTAILDGIVPMRLALGSEHGPSLDQALENIITACQTSDVCAEAFPNLMEAFNELKAEYDRWDEGPRITITHPRLGEALGITFSRTALATALRFLAYDPSTQMLLPYLIHEAATTKRPNRIATQAIIVGQEIDDAIAIGLNFSVGCAEDWPIWPKDQDVSSTLLGDSIGDLYQAICPRLPSEPVGGDFNVPYGGDTPLLLLSGEFDPVTPKSYGEEVLAVSTNAVHLVAKGRGHIVITLPCMGSIATQFVIAGGSDDLDTSCMDALGPEPFFTDLLGPLP